MTLARLLLRPHRWLIGAWLLLLVALTGATPSSYQSTYATPAARVTAAALARNDAASTLLYGNLDRSGSPALMFTWEIGAIATVLTAVMAVLIAVSLTRATEDDGTLELVRATGVDPRAPLRTALLLLVAVAAVLGMGSSLVLAASHGRVDGLTASGALAFGGVLAMTFLLVSTLTALLAQVAPTAGAARLLGFAAVGLAFLLRAVADERQLGLLGWVSPLGLRATVRPFAADRWPVLAAYLVVALGLAATADLLCARREYGAGLVRRADRRDAHLRVRSGLALTRRLTRGSVAVWTLGVAGVATLFTAMGSGVVEQTAEGDVGGFLGAQLGNSDPVAGYFGYAGTVVGMVVCCFTILVVLRARSDEMGGLTDNVLATGARRRAPLGWRICAAAAGTAVILGVAGGLSAVVAPLVVPGDHVSVRAFAFVVGQWPVAMAVAGWTALWVGCWPRVAWLAWTPLVLGGALALLGRLVGVPSYAVNLGPFQHVPDVAGPDPRVAGLAVLLLAAGAATLLGLAGAARRDCVLR